MTVKKPAPHRIEKPCTQRANVDRAHRTGRRIPPARFVAYLLLTWLAFVAASELLLRLAGFAPTGRVDVPAAYDPFRPDPQLIWSLKPNWSGYEPTGARVAINSLGLRGPEVDLDSSNKARRILFLGDSVTYGHGLPQGLTIPAQLQVRCNHSRVDRVHVINAGIPGFSTFQSERYFRERGRALDPDLVLLGFCLNDVTERYSRLSAYGGTRFFMGNVDTSVGMSGPRRLWHRTAIRQALVALIRSRVRGGEQYRVSQLWKQPDAPHIREAWQRAFAEIDRLAEAVEDSGGRFAVVIFPYASQLADAQSDAAPQQVLADHLRSRGIPFLDLLGPLQQSGQPAEVLFLDDNHFSLSGARLAAEEIDAFIREARLVQWHRQPSVRAALGQNYPGSC